MSYNPEVFWIRHNLLSDGSETFDVMVRDTEGVSVEFFNAPSKSSAVACQDAMQLYAGNWR